MARLIPSALVSELSGSVGEVTFRKGQGGLSVGAKQRQPPQPTAAQMRQRAAIGLLRGSWSKLTSSERDSWNALAARLAVASVYNGKMPRRAFSLFMEYNALPVKVQGAPTLVAPNDYKKVTPAITGGVLRTTPLARAAYLNFDDNVNSVNLVYVRLGFRGSQRSALARPVYVTFILGGSLFGNITTEYLAVLPVPRLGQLYQFTYTMQIPGYFPTVVSSRLLTVLS